MKYLKYLFFTVTAATFLLTSCSEDDDVIDPNEISTSNSAAFYPVLVKFTKSESSGKDNVYEVLPGPAAINPEMSPTPFSNNTQTSTGSYTFEVADPSPQNYENSEDAVKSVNIQFTGSNGTKYLIDAIQVIHKPQGAGDHPFFGGVGLNKVMHGNTGIGTNLMPKMLSYITLWGVTDLKNATTGEVIASNCQDITA